MHLLSRLRVAPRQPQLPRRASQVLRVGAEGTPASGGTAAAQGEGPLNKAPLLLEPRTYSYLLSNTREHPALRLCREGLPVSI